MIPVDKQVTLTLTSTNHSSCTYHYLLRSNPITPILPETWSQDAAQNGFFPPTSGLEALAFKTVEVTINALECTDKEVAFVFVCVHGDIA